MKKTSETGIGRRLFSRDSHLPVGRRVLRSADRTVDNVVLVLLILMLMFGIYSLVDSKLVYMSADASNYEVYRPTEDNSKSFAELQEINPEVFGWLTVIGTEIDYPVCRADNNEKYVNTNVEGEYAMVGSLFLDYRNQIDFSDYNNIIYGHHMEQNKFFGCFDEFKDKKFFEEHPYANLYFQGKKHGIELFAFILVDAYDHNFYAVHSMDNEEGKAFYLDYIKNAAMNVLPVDVTTNDTLVVLSTCTEDITNGRFLLIGKLVDKPFKEPPREGKKRFGLGLGNSTGLWSLLPMWKWFIIFAILILMLIYALTILIERWKKGTLSEDAYVLYEDDYDHPKPHE